MKLETRLTVLLGSLLAVFLAALLGLHAVQRRGTDGLRAGIVSDRSRNLGRVLTLDGAPLERFVADYSQWDDMCRFVVQPDPAWAEINLQQSLVSWKFHAAWLFNAEGREIYRGCRAPFAAEDLTALPSAETRAALCRATPGHFFADTPRGLLEIRTSPIHPSDDARLDEPPSGWMFAARLWAPNTLTQLGELTDSTITLEDPLAPPLRLEVPTITVSQDLPDWQGRPLHRLTLRYTSPLLAQMIEYDSNEVLFYLLFGCAFMGLTTWFLNYWVRLPLRRIGESLQRSQPELVASLWNRKDEFGHVATLIRTAEEQRLDLRREVEDRTYAVHELRRAMAERTKLGRDLHDGAIQSIYAIGLRLQGLGHSLDRSSAAAAQQLAVCVDGLNGVIAQLRRHIAGLEENARPSSLAEGLQHLVEELRPVRAIDYRIEIDPLLDAAIPPDSAVQLLWIAREALSNALRHSQATRIALLLTTDSSEPVFLVEDDGAGFVPPPNARRGHGLDNMTRRAEEIGAVLVVESVPTRGTRIRVELSWAMVSPEPDTPAPES